MAQHRDDHSPDFPEYLAATTEVWDQLAGWWDDTIGDGNIAQDVLIEPVTERLLDLQPGEQVLDVACGAGRNARRMANAGAIITAIDHSEKFIQRAKQRSADYKDRINYLTINAADEGVLRSLGEGKFDAAVCTMALMDMASITPLISTLPVLLKPNGRFVFSITHPVFNDGDDRLEIESVMDGTTVRMRHAVSVADYLKAGVRKDIGVSGQPVHYYAYHRPLGMILNTCFEHGFVLDRLEEPAFPEGTAATSPISQVNFTHIPFFMFARMRLGTG